MRPIQNAGGHVGITAREYPIASGTVIAEGQVVKLASGKVVSAVAAEVGAILGIAAENHGVADALNLRATGNALLVYDNPELVFECPAPRFVASGGTGTTVTAAPTEVACATSGGFAGGKLKLVEKAYGSTNTDSVGVVREITGYSGGETASFTVTAGGTAVNGDKYALFPPVGATGVCSLDAASISKFVCSGAGCTKIKVVGHDVARGMIRLMAVEHSLGVEN